MKTVLTRFQRTQNIQDYDEAVDQDLDVLLMDFEYGATHTCVPTGVTMNKMGVLLQALDWHLYVIQDITEDYVREKIKWAAALMDKKFELPYERLPQ